MGMHDLAEDALRIRTELEHRHRNRQNIERSKIHFNSNIKKAQRDLDEALQVARRAQNEVQKAQKNLDDETTRLRRIDDSLQKIAQEELDLAAQLRDLSQQLSREATDKKNAMHNNSAGDTGASTSRSFRTYR